MARLFEREISRVTSHSVFYLIDPCSSLRRGPQLINRTEALPPTITKKRRSRERLFLFLLYSFTEITNDLRTFFSSNGRINTQIVIVRIPPTLTGNTAIICRSGFIGMLRI